MHLAVGVNNGELGDVNLPYIKPLNIKSNYRDILKGTCAFFIIMNIHLIFKNGLPHASN